MNLFSPSILRFRNALLVLFLIAGMSVYGQSQNVGEASGSSSDKVKVDVYPNPTSEQITIDLSKADVDQPKIEIRSIIGSKMNVFLETAGYKKYKVNVSNFPRGYYLVLVREDRSKFQQTVRFSKK